MPGANYEALLIATRINEGARWAVPATQELLEGMATFFGYGKAVSDKMVPDRVGSGKIFLFRLNLNLVLPPGSGEC